MFKSALLLLLAPVAVFAASHNVDVGENGLKYTPDTLTAAVGDTVHFHYFPGDHGVAEGVYSSPCHPKPHGFWSGFINSQSGPAPLMFTITINNTNPILIYCPQDGHCPFGMSMIINAGHGMNLKSYQRRARLTKSQTPSQVEGGKISKNKGGGK